MLYKAMHTRVICVCVTHVWGVMYPWGGQTPRDSTSWRSHLLLHCWMEASVPLWLSSSWQPTAPSQGGRARASKHLLSVQTPVSNQTPGSASCALFSALEVSSWRVWTGAGGDRWGPCWKVPIQVHSSKKTNRTDTALSSL